jgi:CHAT domain-containing protein
VGSALVAFVAYDHHALPVESAPSSAAPTPVPSYAAILLRQGNANPDVIPLGPAAVLDERVLAWKEQVAQNVPSHRQAGADEAYREAGEALRQAAWDSLAAALASPERVFIVPDGSLNLVSLVSLPGGDGRYLIETGPTIHYLSAERDLATFAEVGVRRGSGLLALGGPEYGESGTVRVTPNVPALVAQHTRAAGCGRFEDLRFDPLPAAEREAGEIVSLWRSVQDRAADAPDDVLFLNGAAASEASFKRGAPGRQILHVATHGFFLGGDCAPSAPASPTSRGFKIVEAGEPVRAAAVGPVSPLLLSGLALAGANLRALSTESEEDGVLTAEEIAGLDLNGVDWAVLSACDTGVGAIQAGEGVSGLRRAIQLAGVRTLVMSLWPVDDEATRQWMSAIYRARLVDRLDTAAAVRRAGLTVLESRRRKGESTHPFFWGAFVAAGDWR